ncbi:hypothetical protein TRSC58_02023 [Trypanosoma rangeli SC58]|uniref:Uncharacterized protein n=1 Tax=Trypanosoma rangeli SC58 TaxID=429131 RepID=A0A061JAE6_TRYRA|nr:hypothetical protein TRSC58_02023 [Trypanosoma rangeli SC58]
MEDAPRALLSPQTMSDHVVYGKPLVVTEERLHEARVKQMKQKALRDALDRQVAQGKLHALNNDALETRNNVLKRDAVQKQYTFSCENGCGKFMQQSDSYEMREHPAQTVFSTSTVSNAHNNNAAVWNLVSGHSKPLDFISNNQSLHQSNSLPPNFSMSTSEANPLAPKRTEYNSNSLPVDFAYSGKKQNGSFNQVSPRARRSVPLGVSPKRSPRPVEVVAEGNYPLNCLPRDFSSEDVKRLAHQLKTSPHTTPPPPPQSPLASLGLRRCHANVAPSLYSRPKPHQKQHVGYLPPLDVADGLSSRQKSGEPPPPLEFFGSPLREVSGAQVQNGKNLGHPRLKQLSAPRGPSNDARGRSSVGTLEPRNGQTRATENKVEQLQKKLESRDFQMARMREKEKNWEEQVKQLKMELKSAKKKERDLNKRVKEVPIRAETAPDQPFTRTPKLGFQVPLRRGLGAPSTPGLGKKEKFVKSCIFTKEMFCPISAPSDTVSTSFVPQQQNLVPCMQDSFKCASALTRKTAFGLAEENANRPVPIEYEHLLQFVKEHIITQQQADALWRLFSNEDSPLTLIRQQPSAVRLSGEAGITSMDSYSAFENEMEEFGCDDNDAERKKIEVEEGEDGEEAHNEVGEEVVYGNGHANEELVTEYGTFETFAELHQEECLSQEETDDE